MSPPPPSSRAPRRACGCFSLRAASFVIGASYAAGAMALMVWRITVAADYLSAEDSKMQGDGVAVVCQALLLGAEAIASVLLVIGTCTERHLLVKAWFVFSVSATVLAASVAVVRAAVLGAEQGDVIAAFTILAAATAGLVLAAYCFVVVDSFHAELLRMRHSRLLGL